MAIAVVESWQEPIFGLSARTKISGRCGEVAVIGGSTVLHVYKLFKTKLIIVYHSHINLAFSLLILDLIDCPPCFLEVKGFFYICVFFSTPFFLLLLFFFIVACVNDFLLLCFLQEFEKLQSLDQWQVLQVLLLALQSGAISN